MAKTRSLQGAERSPRTNSNLSQNTSAMAEASTASHLDKMGRELKCPICLSLLDQAASLTCNHVFCNACILRSIKSASVCPVCKVPCSRREVRLAPHMDSLVIIYRNMKIAAGVKLIGSSPCMPKDSRDDPDKENITPCQSGLKRKLSVKSGGKPKKAKGCGLKPSRLSVVSSHQVIENTTTENIEREFPAQAIPSPHQPVKHSFPTKKRVQVSLYPPGSVEESPLRPVSKLSNSEDKVSQSEEGGVNGNMLLTSLDNMHFDSDGQTCLQSEPRACVTVQNSIKDAPVNDRVLLDEHGNPLLAPFFWLREREIEEADGTQMPNSQPTQLTQITQASPTVCPSFSDLKDSDDEGYHRELQNDEHNTGITVPDTFDSEMFEWTQRPCSPELNSSPIKQQSPKASEVVQLAPKLLEGDGALLANGVNKIHEGIIPVNTIENANGSDMERKQESVKDNSNKNANVETAGLPNKPSWKENVKLLSGDEQSCHKRKKSGNVRPETEAVSENAVGKKKRGRKPKRISDRNLHCEGFSHVRDSVVSGDANEPLPDSDKELAFTAADIFDVMFGLPTNKSATDGSVSKTNGDTEIRDQEFHHPLDISSTAQNKVREHLALTLTQECQHGVGSIVIGGNLETTLADTTELQPEAIGNCFGSESSTLKNEFVCVFCQTSGDSEAAGQMMHYSNGRAITKAKEMPPNVVHVHKFCAEWAPVVYFKGDCIMNLETEASRGIKIKCSMCGLKGAALGCCFTKCHRSFHVPCALSNTECRWDIDDYVMLCPSHSSRKFPKEKKSKTLKQDSTLCTRGKKTRTEATPCRGTQISASILAGSEPRQRWTWPSGLSCKWVLCGSALDTAQKETLNNFANLIGATISKTWSPAVTHVIASTDANGACRRTLKFLMAILEGKWILNIDWITSCLKEGSPVLEEGFEITHDIHDTYDGPKRGRLRVEKQEPKLFEGLSFYLCGEFAASLKGYLQDLVSAAGGVVLHRKPIMDQPDCHSTIVLYNVELPEIKKHTEKLEGTSVRSRLKQAKSLADALGAQFAAHTWVLESIAASQLQPTSNGC
ncbi:protein BREAST CANCER SUSCEPTIBILITY 1 homolog isoform X2 [Cryptomeria japonica]|uniref:protein BREAST CANCER SUSCEPTIBILITY 1 homolog isoform X2 n=1 Tax=Cryptomeria japonica TaxID=3369 RepID=UPI0027D9CF5E|nr:protein BREAST CANCER SUSCEPTIBILITY 1 homolog isoform X2 [Cryptomeria japonica]